MFDRVLKALIQSKNEAADDVLLEALRLGNEREQGFVLAALIQRQTNRGLGGVTRLFEDLPAPIQDEVIRQVRAFHHALLQSGRSEDLGERFGAMQIIARARQGKLSYVLSENMHQPDEALSKAAVDAMVGLAQWVAEGTLRLQRTNLDAADVASVDDSAAYRELMDQRPEIEAAIARALSVHRTKHTPDLLRAALLVCDWPGSKTLAILHTTKHAGQSPMVRRLQQPPAAEHVSAFLLGASHAALRSHFGIVFSHIVEAPVLDALLRKTHWLKDHQLQLCMHQVHSGAWWEDRDLLHDIEKRTTSDAALVAEWVGVFGAHDVMQDERLKTINTRLLAADEDDFAARLRVFRVAARRRRGASVELLRTCLNDPDERLVRMACREILRRRPIDFENMLLQLMTSAPDSVRRVVSRALGQSGFDHFWQRFDRLDRTTRKSAGRAMLKLLPDATQRLARRLSSGPLDQRLKALQISQDLELAEQLRESIEPLCNYPDAKVRSKAIAVLGELSTISSEVLIDRVMNDTDARVRANAIEVLEARLDTDTIPLLTNRARSSHNRERANAIKALSRMKVSTASGQLLLMLRDQRAEHKISALWALRQIGFWQLLNEVGTIAKADESLKVRRYALGVLRGVAELLKDRQSSTPSLAGEPQELAG